MTEFNHEKLKKILFDWRCKSDWERWSQKDKKEQEAWIKAVENYAEVGYPDPETAVARVLIRD